MTISRSIYHKSSMRSRWLFAISLLFSIFVFTGYTDNSAFPPHQITKTELVYSISNKNTKKTIALKKVSAPEYKTDCFYKSDSLKAIALLHYNRLTKVRLADISTKFYSIKITDPFIQIKLIPQSPVKDIFISITG